MTRIVFTNANLLDGDNPARPANVVVSGDRIESVGNGPAETRPDDRVIDLAGKTLMPGMVCGHFHAAYWGTGGGGGRPVGLECHPSLQAVRAVANMKTALDCGFTGAIGAGSPHQIDAALKTAVEEGTIAGPRLMTGSRDVGTTGFSADMSNPSFLQIGAQTSVTTADGPDAMARIVRQEVKDGAEIVKFFLTGGHATGGTGADWLMTEAEFAAGVGAAHQRGAKARAHLASKESILLSVKLGVHIVDHGDGLDEECFAPLIDSNTFLTPSLLFPKEMMAVMPGHAFTDAMKQPWDEMAAILPAASKAGVKLLIGDDYGAFTLTHGRYGEEMELYVRECGVPALDVIRWATKHGAEAMGIDAGRSRPASSPTWWWSTAIPRRTSAVLKDRAKILAVMKGGVAAKDGLAAADELERLLTYRPSRRREGGPRIRALGSLNLIEQRQRPRLGADPRQSPAQIEGQWPTRCARRRERVGQHRRRSRRCRNMSAAGAGLRAVAVWVRIASCAARTASSSLSNQQSVIASNAKRGSGSWIGVSWA